MSEGKRLPQYITAACFSIGAMCTGTCILWNININQKIAKGELNGIQNITILQMQAMRGINSIGAAISCIPAALVASKIGQKMTAFMCLIPAILGWVTIIFGKNIGLIYLGRFVTGIGCGPFCFLVPLYTTDIAQLQIRGRLGAFYQVFFMLGILYSSFFGWLLPVFIYNIACGMIPVIFSIVLCFLPNSPVESIRKKKYEQAENDLQKLRGKDYDCSQEFEVIKERILKEQPHTKLKSFRTKPVPKSLLICVMLMVYQQFSGICAVLSHMEDTYTDAGASFDRHYSGIITYLFAVMGTALTCRYVDKFGRKILLMLSSAFVALNAFLLAFYFSIKKFEVGTTFTLRTIAYVPAVALIMFIVFFSIGIGPVPWVVSAEIFPSQIVLECSAIAGTVSWILSFFVNAVFPREAALTSDVILYIFGTLAVTGIYFVHYMVPETKLRTYEEIELELIS